MSNVRNIANGINVGWPVPGANNSTQGFRANSISTQNALFQTSDELGILQKTQLQVTGDATSLTGTLDQAAQSGNNYILNVPLVLTNVLSGTLALDTRSQDFTLTFDTKGRVTGSTIVTHSLTFASGHTAGSPISSEGTTNLGTGTDTITFPTFTFNAKGRLTATGKQSIPYGLIGQNLTAGRLLVGDTTSGNVGKSVPLAMPNNVTSPYGLVTQDGNTVSWLPYATGTVTGLVAGPGIAVTSDPATPTVRVDISNTTHANDISSSDLLLWHDTSSNALRNINFTELQGAIVKVVTDTTPQLGGDLDVGTHKITSSAGGVLIESDVSSPKSSIEVSETALALQGSADAPVSLNGLEWPLTGGTNGQFLTMASASTMAWTTPTPFYQTIPFTIFVSNQGNDTTGNGSMNAPYATINKALTLVPNNSNDFYTILILGGTYPEDINLFGKKNLAMEGFFSSTNPQITGRVLLDSSVSTLLVSNITWDNTDRDDDTPIVDGFLNINKAEFINCEFLRGPDLKSDRDAISLVGQMLGDVIFTNCIIQGKVNNNAVSYDGARLVLQNLRLPSNGWTGLTVGLGSNTYVNNAPLMSGVRHDGGILNMENIGSIKPSTYDITVQPPALPMWQEDPSDNNELKPLFLDEDFNPVFEDAPGAILQVLDEEVFLLDQQGNPIDDPNNAGESIMTIYRQATEAQPSVTTQYVVGLYSTVNSDDGDILATPDAPYTNRLELNNVIFYYDGDFPKLYKSGNCEWSFNRVKRRSDQDTIRGPRISYDVQPDEGQFMAHYTASGANLRHAEDSSPVDGGVIDANAGKCFQVELTGTATVKIKTPDMTAYAPGPLPVSGEMYAEVIIIIKQDTLGGRNVNFQDDLNLGITWLTSTGLNTNPGGLTFFIFRYFSRQRIWTGQRISDGGSLRITAKTDSTYTLQLGDAGSYIRRNYSSANTVVVPNNSTVPFPIGSTIKVVQTGVGSTSISPAPGVVVNTPYGYLLEKQFSSVTLTKVSNNTWDLEGSLDTNSTVDPILTVDSMIITVDSTTVDVTG